MSPAPSGVRFQSAQWIWMEGAAAPVNAVVDFRREFSLRTRPATAWLLISADSRYVVWINGRRLGFGPARNFPEHYEFDVHDVAEWLHTGRNVLCVRVQHWGEGNIQSLVSRGGLVAEVQDAAGRVLAATDGGWKACRSPEFVPVTPRIACMMPFEEQVTAAAADWLGPGEWTAPPAVPVGPAGCAPWGAMRPRTIPLLTDEPWECVASRSRGEVEAPALVLPLRAGLSLCPGEVSMNTLEVDGLFATVLRVPRAGRLWIKHGAMYSGPVRLYLDGRRLEFLQDEFDLRAERDVEAGRHVLVVDWQGRAHDLDISLAMGGVPGVAQVPFARTPRGPWVFARPDGVRSAVQQAATPAALAQAAPWRDLATEAVPRHDAYMTATCRVEREAGDVPVGTLPWSGGVLAPGRAHRVVLDFGRHANGFVELDLVAGRGTRVDALGVEGINHGRLQFTELNNNSFSYVCREGAQTFTSQQPRGLRYLVLDVEPRGRPVRLTGARIRVATYPWRPRGSFRCSDTKLNHIYELCVHTLRMSSMDTFVDATYEQALWVGDMASMILQVHHYVQGEALLPDRCLRLAAQSLERMPLVNSQVPSAWENRPIPNWSFLWALGVRDHFTLTGDRDFAAELHPALETQASFIERCLDAEGLFQMHGDVWHFLDWNGCEDDHRAAARRTYAHENALAVAALRATAEVAQVAGRPSRAKHWAGLAEWMARSARRAFWLRRERAFGETRADGVTTNSITASTQICALMAGLFPKGMEPLVARQVILPPPGWLPTGTPWMWSLGARLAMEHGDIQPALQGMRRHWGGMLDRGATTAWEMFEGRHRPGLPTRSWCHGWSAGPAWQLPAYVLGVRPAAAGWRDVMVAPQAGDLEWAEGSVPTPHGVIEVRWERGRDGVIHVEHALPGGVRVVAP